MFQLSAILEHIYAKKNNANKHQLIPHIYR